MSARIVVRVSAASVLALASIAAGVDPGAIWDWTPLAFASRLVHARRRRAS